MLAGLRQQTRGPRWLELIGTLSKTTVEVMPCGVLAMRHLPVDETAHSSTLRPVLGVSDMADYAPRLVYDANDP